MKTCRWRLIENVLVFFFFKEICFTQWPFGEIVSFSSHIKLKKKLIWKCGTFIWRLWLGLDVRVHELKAPQHGSVRVVAFLKKTQSDTARRAGFTVEVSRDSTLDRLNDSCQPITAAARLPPQRAAASAAAACDSPTHWLVFTDLQFLFYGAAEATTNHKCNKLTLTAVQRGKKQFPSEVLFSFSSNDSSQSCVVCWDDSVCRWGHRGSMCNILKKKMRHYTPSVVTL